LNDFKEIKEFKDGIDNKNITVKINQKHEEK